MILCLTYLTYQQSKFLITFYYSKVKGCHCLGVIYYITYTRIRIKFQFVCNTIIYLIILYASTNNMVHII